MRSVFAAVILTGFLAASAQAAEIRILTPAVVQNSGLDVLAAAYAKKTGIKVTVVRDTMGQMVGHIEKSDPPADVVFLAADRMKELDSDHGVVAGTLTPLGRVNIGLAVEKGAAHPDISTVSKLVAAMKASKGVLYSNPDPRNGSMSAQMIDRMLKRPEFASVHKVITTTFNGVGSLEGGQALASGKYPGYMALQLVCEILPHSEISLVGPLPQELGQYIDTAAGISVRSKDQKDARDFLHYITQPEAKATWSSKGLNRF